MEIDSTPRINSSMLSSYSNRTVRLVGKVLSVQNGQALLETSDSGQVSVRMHPATPPYNCQFVEVIGRVDGNLSVQELSVVGLGNDFGMG